MSLCEERCLQDHYTIATFSLSQIDFFIKSNEEKIKNEIQLCIYTAFNIQHPVRDAIFQYIWTTLENGKKMKRIGLGLNIVTNDNSVIPLYALPANNWPIPKSRPIFLYDFLMFWRQQLIQLRLQLRALQINTGWTSYFNVKKCSVFLIYE